MEQDVSGLHDELSLRPPKPGREELPITFTSATQIKRILL